MLLKISHIIAIVALFGIVSGQNLRKETGSTDTQEIVVPDKTWWDSDSGGGGGGGGGSWYGSGGGGGGGGR